MAISFDLADHVVGFMIDSDVTKEDLNQIENSIQERIEKHGPVHLFCEIMADNKIPLKHFLECILFRNKNQKNIVRMAIVTDYAWVRRLIKLNNKFIDINIRTYRLRDRLEAIAWISE